MPKNKFLDTWVQEFIKLNLTLLSNMELTNMNFSIQYYNSEKDNWTKGEELTPSTTLEQLCEKMVQHGNARIYVGRELGMVLYRTGSFESKIGLTKEPGHDSEPLLRDDRNQLDEDLYGHQRTYKCAKCSQTFNHWPSSGNGVNWAALCSEECYEAYEKDLREIELEE